MLTTQQPFISQSFSMLYHVILHQIASFKMVDSNLKTADVFLKNQHFSFIGLYRPTSLQQGKKCLHVLIGYSYILMNCIKCMCT